ncbi:MAG: helix-turn-helix domain-containing protein [Bacteroidota bacterium]
MGFIFIATFTQSTAAAMLLWQFRERNRAERFLWLFLAMFSLHMAIKFAFLEIIKAEILYEYFSTPVSLGYPPILFFYVLTTQSGSPPSLKTQFLHLLPLFIFSVVYFSLGIHFYKTLDYTLIYEYKRITRIATIVSNVIYIPIILKILHQEKKRFPQFRGLILPMYAWSLLTIPYLTFNVLSDGYSHLILSLISGGLLLFFTVSISVNVLKSSILVWRQKAYQSENEVHTLQVKVNELEHKVKYLGAKAADTIEDKTPKYEKSGLSKEHAVMLEAAIKRLMTVEKLYLNPDLVLADLATRLNTPKHHITEVLNVQLRKNFFLFVNEYRIEKAKYKIAAGEAHNLFLLAHNCGFNSKTTFIKYFKKIVGVTPSQYRKSLALNKTKSKK